MDCVIPYKCDVCGVESMTAPFRRPRGWAMVTIDIPTATIRSSEGNIDSEFSIPIIRFYCGKHIRFLLELFSPDDLEYSDYKNEI